MTEMAGKVRRVLRRCAQCRLLFEALEGADACVVCGVPVVGRALWLDADAAPSEVVEREPTARMTVRRSSN